ncbi:MAG: flippase [bacterium]|nr:flippase [bacterium]
MRQTLLKNTFWLSFSEISGRLLKAVIIIYAARVLGVEGFGTFSYVMGLAGLLTIFSDLGVGNVLIREGAKDPTARKRYFSAAATINFLLSFVSALVIIFITPLASTISLSQALLLAVAVVFVFDSWRGLGSALFRTIERMELEALANILTQVAFIIAGFFLLVKMQTPESLAFTYAAASVAGFLISFYLARKYVKGLFARFDRKLVRSILSASLPISIAGILGGLMINTDIVLLGWLTDARQVGLFTAAQKPILFLYLIPSFIAGGIFPTLARLVAQDQEKSRLLISKGLTATFLFALPITAGLLLASGDIVRLLYGNDYLPAIFAFQILAGTIFIMFPVSILHNAIFAYDRQKFLMRVSVVGVALNAILDLILIPFWGIAGAALATLCTQAIIGAAMWHKAKRLNNFSILRALPKIAFATLIMGSSVVLLEQLNLPILLIIFLASLVYVTTLFLLKETLLRDLKAILVS